MRSSGPPRAARLDPDKVSRAALSPRRVGERCGAEAGVWRPRVDPGRCEGKADCVAVWSPEDWLEASSLYELIDESETVARAARRLDAEAAAEGVYLDGDVEKYLAERLDTWADEQIQNYLDRPAEGPEADEIHRDLVRLLGHEEAGERIRKAAEERGGAV